MFTMLHNAVGSTSSHYNDGCVYMYVLVRVRTCEEVVNARECVLLLGYLSSISLFHVQEPHGVYSSLQGNVYWSAL